MQDYKFICAAAMTCPTMVNTQTDTQPTELNIPAVSMSSNNCQLILVTQHEMGIAEH